MTLFIPFVFIGWRAAGLYLLMGLGIAVIARLWLEHCVEGPVWQIQLGPYGTEGKRLSWKARLTTTLTSAKEFMRKVWPYVIIGAALGAGIHGYVENMEA